MTTLVLVAIGIIIIGVDLGRELSSAQNPEKPCFFLYGGGNSSAITQSPCGMTVGKIDVGNKEISIDIKVWDTNDCPTSFVLEGPINDGADFGPEVVTIDVSDATISKVVLISTIEHGSGDTCDGTCNIRYRGTVPITAERTLEALKAFPSNFKLQSYSDIDTDGQHRIAFGENCRS